ncbi:MAG TPA: thioesterase family protein [Acidimicrobiia bacterium]|jgi:YbgC/YbaW family acyl-CoA thioester hydrolase|nr:thioesterase family protein [Acidimicrobiia bacterium]
MDWPVIYRRKVRYSDSDAQGIVFNANYLAYFDDAIADYFEALGYPGHELHRTGHEVLVAHAEVDFLTPGRIGDELAVGVRVDRIGTTSVRFVLEAWNETTRAPVVRGHEIYVLVDHETFQKKPVPQFFIDAIERLQGEPPAD